MTKDEIYERLAQVYLGKRENVVENKKRKQVNLWLLTNIAITIFVLVSVFYGLTAFLSGKSSYTHHNIIFALNNSPIRLKYDFHEPFPQVHDFSISIPRLNMAKYNHLTFSIRGLEDGPVGILKVVVANKKKESSAYLVQDVDAKWQKITIPFKAFDKITDWSNVTSVSFVIEAWNADKKNGMLLIDDICFSDESLSS